MGTCLYSSCLCQEKGVDLSLSLSCLVVLCCDELVSLFRLCLVEGTLTCLCSSWPLVFVKRQDSTRHQGSTWTKARHHQDTKTPRKQDKTPPRHKAPRQDNIRHARQHGQGKRQDSTRRCSFAASLVIPPTECQ